MVIYMFDLLVAKSQIYKTKFAYKLTNCAYYKHL